VNSRLLAGPYRLVHVGTHDHEFDPQAPQQIRPPRRPGSEDEVSHRSRFPPRTTATGRPRVAGSAYGSAAKKTASAGAPASKRSDRPRYEYAAREAASTARCGSSPRRINPATSSATSPGPAARSVPARTVSDRGARAKRSATLSSPSLISRPPDESAPNIS